MKHWDRAVTAEGIDLGVWMDAQAGPEIVTAEGGVLVIEFRCWEPLPHGTAGAPRVAPYRGRIRFTGVEAFRVLSGELGPYRFDRGRSAHPECLFEVRLSGYEAGRRMERDSSWLPTVERAYDPAGWFSWLDSWIPEAAPPPSLPAGTRHFVVDGRDGYVEALACRYEFDRVTTTSG